MPSAVCLSPVLLINYCLPDNFTTNFLFNATDEVWWQVYNYSLYVAVFAMLVLPVFTYIAILRYRLYDIDLLINRTLVYGTLTACVVAPYVLVVGYFGVVLRTGANLATSLAATGLIAVLFAPLRDRLQRGVNRLMYGERDEPYKVLSDLGASLEATSPQSLCCPPWSRP